MSIETPHSEQRIEHVVDRDVLEAAGLDTACPVCGHEFERGHHECQHSDLRRVCGDCCPRCL